MVELVRDLRSTEGYESGDFKTFAVDCGSVEFEAIMANEGPYDYVFNLSALKHVSSIFDCEVVTSLERFKQQSEIILTNRLDDVLDEVKDKVFTRDIYGNN